MLAALLLAAVELSAPDLELRWHERLPVALRNLGSGRARLHLAGERGGLQVAPAVVELAAGAQGQVELDVFRGRAPWGSRPRLRLVAVDEGGLAAGVVELQARVAAEPYLLPRLRWPLLGLGLGLLGWALRGELGPRRLDPR